MWNVIISSFYFNHPTSVHLAQSTVVVGNLARHATGTEHGGGWEPRAACHRSGTEHGGGWEPRAACHRARRWLGTSRGMPQSTAVVGNLARHATEHGGGWEPRAACHRAALCTRPRQLHTVLMSSCRTPKHLVLLTRQEVLSQSEIYVLPVHFSNSLLTLPVICSQNCSDRILVSVFEPNFVIFVLFENHHFTPDI